MELDRVYVGDITYIWTWSGVSWANLSQVRRAVFHYIEVF